MERLRGLVQTGERELDPLQHRRRHRAWADERQPAEVRRRDGQGGAGRQFIFRGEPWERRRSDVYESAQPEGVVKRGWWECGDVVVGGCAERRWESGKSSTKSGRWDTSEEGGNGGRDDGAGREEMRWEVQI